MIYMLRGTQVSKRMTSGGGSSSSAAAAAAAAAGETALAERCLVLSPDLTRVEVREAGKRLPESFMKIEHIIRVQDKMALPSDLKLVNSGVSWESFSLIAKERQLELLCSDAVAARAWVDGIRILVSRCKTVFYLKFHLTEVVGEELLGNLVQSRRKA